jgi:hypothetical protein
VPPAAIPAKSATATAITAFERLSFSLRQSSWLPSCSSEKRSEGRVTCSTSAISAAAAVLLAAWGAVSLLLAPTALRWRKDLVSLRKETERQAPEAPADMFTRPEFLSYSQSASRLLLAFACTQFDVSYISCRVLTFSAPSIASDCQSLQIIDRLDAIVQNISKAYLATAATLLSTCVALWTTNLWGSHLPEEGADWPDQPASSQGQPHMSPGQLKR